MTTFRFAIDPEPEAEALEAGRRLFTRPVGFLKGVVALDGLPPGDRPEICFAGRSNVGKSTLINALTGRKGLARASNTPGRTQEINYFTLAEAGYLVDLPGYGYAKAPRPKVEGWQALLRAYLAGRATLRRCYLLIDARHGLKQADHDHLDLLDRAAVSTQVILTKGDKPKGAQRDTVLAGLQDALARHPTVFPEVLTTSAETGVGIDTLRAAISDTLA